MNSQIVRIIISVSVCMMSIVSAQTSKKRRQHQEAHTLLIRAERELEQKAQAKRQRIAERVENKLCGTSDAPLSRAEVTMRLAFGRPAGEVLAMQQVDHIIKNMRICSAGVDELLAQFKAISACVVACNRDASARNQTIAAAALHTTLEQHIQNLGALYAAEYEDLKNLFVQNADAVDRYCQQLMQEMTRAQALLEARENGRASGAASLQRVCLRVEKALQASMRATALLSELDHAVRRHEQLANQFSTLVPNCTFSLYALARDSALHSTSAQHV